MLQERIKILYPILHYPPVIGGLEQWSQNIAERQPEECEVLVVTGRVRGEPNKEEKKNVSVFRTSFFELGDLSHSPKRYILFAIPCIFFRSLLLAHSCGVDIFHCHGFISALMGCALSMLTGKPFIVTEQSTGWSGGTLSWLRGIIYRKAAVCVGASNATKDEFRKLGVERVLVIPNGVDVEQFRECADCARKRDGMGGFTVLGVGRLEKVKGYRYLIEAFQKIKKEIPESRLMLIGDGSEKENLKREAEALRLEDSVEFLGEIAHDALPHYYHRADVFIMPSLAEGFGITALEAMAAGLPVVVTKVGGLLDIVENEKTGILVKSGNTEDIFHAVVRLYRDEHLRSRLVESAQRKVSDFDWNQSAKKISDIYRAAVISKRHALR